MDKRHERAWMAAALAAGSIALGGAVQAQGALPAVQQQGSVQFVTGGVGLDESEAMKAASKDYPLALTFAARGDGRAGLYLADVAVQILDRTGKPVLDAKADGPYLLAKLPAGTYRVKATSGGVEQTRQVSVRPGSTARAVFEWKD
ncbi:carboxypeptidase-like regulatory domain-containing protein [Bordetella bronchiseptica]